MHRRRRLLVTLAASLALAGMAAGPAAANHSWGGYHWARRANPFTLQLGDNVSGAWDSVLGTTSSDWTASSVLDTRIVAGRGVSARQCRPTNGRVEVCNSAYGSTGWLGIASIWASGSHITQGTVKLNDSYFNTAQYNTTAWRNLVSCQEVGHTFGLGHQDESFTNANLNTCMDYTNAPTSNQHPNQHDYNQLATTYGHLDATTTVGAVTGQAAPAVAAGNSEGQWGRTIRRSADNRPSEFERDLGRGQRLYTFVVWAE